MMLNRTKLIRQLYSEVDHNIALLSLLMGDDNPLIAEEYYNEKKERKNLQSVLDMENHSRYTKMINPLLQELIIFLKRVEE